MKADRKMLRTEAKAAYKIFSKHKGQNGFVSFPVFFENFKTIKKMTALKNQAQVVVNNMTEEDLDFLDDMTTSISTEEKPTDVEIIENIG